MFRRWLEAFTRDQLLIVNGDLLIEDPVSQIQKIERFLGIEPRIGTHNFYFNETKGFYCLRNETSDRYVTFALDTECDPYGFL